LIASSEATRWSKGRKHPPSRGPGSPHTKSKSRECQGWNQAVWVSRHRVGAR